MARFVFNLKWLGRLSWAVSALLFIAVKFFGAPLATFFIGAWIMIVLLVHLHEWGRDRHSPG